jgi:D-sedoheptulose 7-phosphate isomerase
VSTEDFFSQEIEKRSAAFRVFPLGATMEMQRKLHEISLKNSSIFLAGNGGSASTAQHFSIDLGVGSKLFVEDYKTYCLSDNQSQITAIANDFSYDEIFSRQLQHYGRAGDCVVVFSASGNSSNLISLIQTAKDIGVYTIAVLGFDGGRIKEMADLAVLFETRVGEYGLVEDLHLSLCHMITSCARFTSHS